MPDLLPDLGDRAAFREQLRQAPVYAVLRAADADRFLEVAEVLLEAGVSSIELTLTTPGALSSLAALRAALPPAAFLGVGSVRTPEQLRAAHGAGAAYAVTPHLRLDLIETALDLGLPIIPGALTASEVVTAWEAGASAVKIFPVSAMGGPSYIKALLAPLPEVPLMPSGGVSIEDIPAYRAAGAAAVGISTPLLGDLSTIDLQVVADRARRATELAAAPW
jgi:2-dehydro-3-deoxyphosphogluconate aldolase/(4S)-4-hydroxy-2-oxoglutarate aldolase